MTTGPEAWIDRVRSLCLALPKVVESGGTASGVGALSGTRVGTFKVSGRVVARTFVLDPGGRDDVVLWLRADPEERAALVAAADGRSFAAGLREVGLVVDDDVDWTEVAELVTESYLLVAPRRLADELRLRLGSGPRF